MSPYLFVGTIALILAVLVYVIAHIGPEAPKVKSHDAIDEEIRRERLDLHNAGCAYAEHNRGLCADHTANESHALSVEMMLAAAFRQGAKWQRRRDS